MADEREGRTDPERDAGAANLNTPGASDAGDHSTDDPRDLGAPGEGADPSAPPAEPERGGAKGRRRPARARKGQERSVPPKEPIPSWIEGDEPGVSQPPG